MGSQSPEHPTVFISYSHESPEHEARVLELANRLRRDGIDADIDQYVPGGLPPLGWPRWMEDRIQQTDFTIMVCTETYKRRVEHKEPPGVGRGVMWEADVVYQLLYESDEFKQRTVPVLLSGGTLDDVPVPVRGNRVDLSRQRGYEDLLRRLRRSPAAERPPLGDGPAPKPLPPKTSAWSAFAPFIVPNHQLSDYFTGRDDILTRLHDDLTTRRRAALSGLGGVGKTQTALAFAHRHRNAYEDGVFWVDAENVTVLTTGFVDIARRLQLPAGGLDDEAAAVGAVLRWFNENVHWLLVLDNVEDLAVARAHMPDRTGHVLVTTRHSTLYELGIPACIEVLELAPDDAVRFLLDRTGRRDDDPAEAAPLRSLAKVLGFLPLALEQAAAYISQNGSRFSAYLASYRKQRLTLLEKSRALVGGYGERIGTTWATNFEAVEQHFPASADVLRASSFFHTDRIPFELLAIGASKLGGSIAAALTDPDDALQVDELLTPLATYSLIRRDRETATYAVHRLVQDVIFEYMDDAARSVWLRRAVDAMNAAFPGVEYSNWETCDRFLPHAQAVTARILENEGVGSRAASRLLNQTAYYLTERGRYAEAQPRYERALAIVERALGPEHPYISTSLNNLALLFQYQGRYAEAQPLFERALAIRERALEPEHPNVATSLHNLAGLFRRQGRYAEAQPLSERALAIYERALGPEHPNVAASLTTLAALFDSQGRYVQAQPLFERALAIRERALGPEHPYVAISLNNLAGLMRAQGRYSKAQPLSERALAIYERALGPEHPNVASGLNDLAAIFDSQGRYAEAQPLYERALAIRERVLGPDHPNVAISLDNLARLFCAQGRDVQAQPLYARALVIRERTKDLTAYTCSREPLGESGCG